MKKVILKKTSVLEGFARRVPNAQKIFVDNGRDILTVQTSGEKPEAFNYKISEILEKSKAYLVGQGFDNVIFI